VVRTDNREHDIREAFRLMGGLEKLVRGTKGEIIIKPNCNTDDSFPGNSSHETIRSIAQGLIDVGVHPERICIGDTSGK